VPLRPRNWRDLERRADELGVSFLRACVLLAAPGENVLQHVEDQLVMAALDEFGGQQNKAAQMLGISRRTMNYKLGKLGLRPVDGE
jgi:DNA-binding NtrC family response regulator